MMHTEPTDAHRWLQRLVGAWTCEFDAAAPGAVCADGSAGDGPAESCMAPGREVVRPVGGLWIVAEGRAGSGKDAWESVMTLGYDPGKGRFTGTFIASMMTHLWLYDGALDASGETLVLHADGPDFSGAGMTKFVDRITLRADGVRRLTSEILGADGKWTQFMGATYRRAV